VGALAEGGEILVTTSTVTDGFPFGVTDEREVTLRGIAQPVRIAAIEWRSP
jgi:class 3 adenylate cyclase